MKSRGKSDIPRLRVRGYVPKWLLVLVSGFSLFCLQPTVMELQGDTSPPGSVVDRVEVSGRGIDESHRSRNCCGCHITTISVVTHIWFCVLVLYLILFLFFDQWLNLSISIWCVQIIFLIVCIFWWVIMCNKLICWYFLSMLIKTNL